MPRKCSEVKFMDLKQQQSDWTRQCLRDLTGPDLLVPPSAKKDQSIARLVDESLEVARQCWLVLLSLFLNLPRFPCEQRKYV